VLVPLAWAVRGTLLERCSIVVQVCVVEGVCWAAWSSLEFHLGFINRMIMKV
jgi:hypothetical protein